MKVYVLHYILPFEIDVVMGVFSSQELVDKFITEHPLAEKYAGLQSSIYDVEELEIDAPISENKLDYLTR